jgi:hypothetical protein
MVYSDRTPEIRHIACGEFKGPGKRHTQSGVLDAIALAVEQVGAERGFSPDLGWLHYRTRLVGLKIGELTNQDVGQMDS